MLKWVRRGEPLPCISLLRSGRCFVAAMARAGGRMPAPPRTPAPRVVLRLMVAFTSWLPLLNLLAVAAPARVAVASAPAAFPPSMAGFVHDDFTQVEQRDTGASSSGAEDSAFCALPEMLQTWRKVSGCNGAPQFLSAFCPDHERVSNQTLVCTVDDTPCTQDKTHQQCNQLPHTSSGVNFVGSEVSFGNTSFVLKPAAGDAIVTNLVAYSGSSFGLGFNGHDLTTISISVGSAQSSAKLPFDAGKGFHRYDMIWGSPPKPPPVNCTPGVTCANGETCPASGVCPPGQCATYCGSSDCGWTSTYSCPWAPPGPKGHAGDDGSIGYKCCCVYRTNATQPCGGNESTAAETLPITRPQARPRAQFFADGQLLTLDPPIPDSAVPDKPMPLYVFVYGCGASWCGPAFDCKKSCPATTEFKSIAFTPEGQEPAECKNPPAPPAFCDSDTRLQTAWKPTDDCPHPNSNNQTWAYFANHVVLDSHQLHLTVDQNITGGKWYCIAHNGFSQAAAQVTGASYVHYGRITAVMRVGGDDLVSSLVLGVMNSTAGIALVFDGSGKVASFQVNTSPPQELVRVPLSAFRYLAGS